MDSLVRESKFEIGDRVFLNIPEGDCGLVIAIVVYEDHFEYIIRTINTTLFVSGLEITNEKVIV